MLVKKLKRAPLKNWKLFIGRNIFDLIGAFDVQSKVFVASC
jgi:hypothetical protein